MRSFCAIPYNGLSGIERLSLKIWVGFVLASLMAVLQSALFEFTLLPYAPFIALACMSTTKIRALWLAALAGLMNDLLSTDPFGIYALASVASCAALYDTIRKGFFKEQPLQLCLFTALISLLFIPFTLFMLFLFDRRPPVAGESALLLDCLLMPLLDAAYAFFWFTGPLWLLDWTLGQIKLWKLKKNAAAE